MFVGQNQTIKNQIINVTRKHYMSLISGFIVSIQRYRNNAAVADRTLENILLLLLSLSIFYHLTGRLNYYNTLAQLSRTHNPNNNVEEIF